MGQDFHVSAFRVFEVWLILLPVTLFTFTIILCSGLAPVPVAWFGVFLMTQFLVEGLCFVFIFGMTAVSLFASFNMILTFPFLFAYSSGVVGPYPTQPMVNIMLSMLLMNMVVFMLLIHGSLKRNQAAAIAVARQSQLDGRFYSVDRFEPSVGTRSRTTIIYIIILTAVFAIGSSFSKRPFFLETLFLAILYMTVTIFFLAMVIYWVKHGQ